MALGLLPLVYVQADTVVRWQRERFRRCNRCDMPERSGTGYVAESKVSAAPRWGPPAVHGIGILELHGYRSTSTGQRHLGTPRSSLHRSNATPASGRRRTAQGRCNRSFS